MNELSRVEAGMTVRENGTEIVRGAETAMAAIAAQQKAFVEAQFVVAFQKPRKWPNIRIAVNNLCKDPAFAAEALYVKPISKTADDWNRIDKRERLRRRLTDESSNWPVGFSIRAIEAILFECGNFDTDATIVWEDDEKRLTRVRIVDLERNSTYSRTVTTPKTVERNYLKKGQEALATRFNTNGATVYIVAATPQEVDTAEAAGVSKAIRTMGERLLPPHFKAEWRRLVEQTILDQDAKDPQATAKVLFDNFAKIGVLPDAIEKYLGHQVEAMQPAELAVLRKIYVALSNAEITWADVMATKEPDEDEGQQEQKKDLTGAAKVKDILQRKNAPASQAGAGEQKREEPKPDQPSEQKQPAEAPTTSSAAAAPAEVVAPPTDLPDYDEWPDTLTQDWYKVQGVLYRFNEADGQYRKWEQPPSQQQSTAKPNGTGRSFSFGGRRQG